MAEIDLKIYTTRVKELEAAIYTQKNLMSSYLQIIKEQKPTAPKKKTIKTPEKPKEPTAPYKVIFPVGLFITSIVATIIGLVVWLILFLGEDKDIFTQLGELFFFIIAAVGCYGMYYVLNNNSKDTEKYNEEYEKYIEDEKKYPRLLARYNKAIEQNKNDEMKYELEYNIAFAKYEEELRVYNKKYQDMKLLHESNLLTLTNTLQKLYDENIIFPKYRNFVAISAINEYIVSGRCASLEGADGSYNLYEMELRQNIIINQLSNILDNLEQIKYNQFSLYMELKKSNETINEILTETRQMKETTKLTAYFANITALAETSPNYYYGIIT